MMPPKASVIIPTYNGVKKLPDTLNALCSQSEKSIEVIVVVDGSTDNTQKLLQSYEHKFDFFNVIVQPNGGRAKARNRGAEVARAEVIIFIDDDIEIHPHNLEGHLTFLQNHPSAILVGFAQLNFERVKHDPFLTYRYAVEQRAKQNIPEGLQEVSFQNYLFTSANMSVRKDIFFAAGKFDEGLTDSEDFDFSVRLLRSGYKIYFNKQLTAFHNDFADLRSYINRQRQYYDSKKKVMELHPEYITLLPRQYEWTRKLQTDAVKRWVFGNGKFWFNFFSGKMFTFLPAAVQYVLYSSFIYTQSVLPVKNSV